MSLVCDKKRYDDWNVLYQNVSIRAPATIGNEIDVVARLYECGYEYVRMRGRRRSYVQAQISTKINVRVYFRTSNVQRKTERALAKRARYSQDAKESNELNASLPS